jgi:protoheme IX farnesyltransferase
LGYAGVLYGIVAVITGIAMVVLALRIHREGAQHADHAASKRMFGFSILYLFLLFATLLVDRFAAAWFGHFAA